MNKILINALKVSRRVYLKQFSKQVVLRPACINEPEIASEQITHLLAKDKPVMIARLGAHELSCIANYIGVKSNTRSWSGYVKGNVLPWWWNESIIKKMHTHAGFFPANISAIERFCELILQDIPEVDLLGSWLPDERLFEKELVNIPKVDLELLNPYFSKIPWTQALVGKRVLVIHPFAHTIEAQYQKRQLLFKNNLLPEFELKTIKAVQSIAGEKTEFKDWFDALDSMKSAMDNEEYDICLIGCGAYGFPLAAHAKHLGKKGFHMGGSLQLLFGIRGKRWENPNYNATYDYSRLMNEHWVKPASIDIPQAANQVEGACYW